MPGSSVGVGVREDHAQDDRAGRRVHRDVAELELALARVGRAVLEQRASPCSRPPGALQLAALAGSGAGAGGRRSTA